LIREKRSKSVTGFIRRIGIKDWPQAQAVRNHAFRDLKLPRVISLIHLDNIPSRRAAEKNGMKLEKETVFRSFPTLVFALSREEWSQNSAA
jgi:RimJ/RimL family protein N-acetyltransferase